VFTKVMVPLDGSELAERALPCAERLAATSGAVVHLVRATEPVWATSWGPTPVYLPAGEYDEIVKTEAKVVSAYLTAVSAPLVAEGVHVQMEHLVGSPASSLLDYERETGIDLVVMCSNGRSGLTRFALGSVAEHLLRHGKAPLVLVRAYGDPVRLDHVVVPLDGSARAEVALDMIHSLAPSVVQDVLLVRVIGTPDQGPEAERYLAGIASRLSRDGLTCRSQVAQGDPATVILGAAGADNLVVMASHGRSVLTRWALGSVADRVARGGAAAVLLLRPGEVAHTTWSSPQH
jgi:nucleotide-binding universal stress UspA family protein